MQHHRTHSHMVGTSYTKSSLVYYSGTLITFLQIMQHPAFYDEFAGARRTPLKNSHHRMQDYTASCIHRHIVVVLHSYSSSGMPEIKQPSKTATFSASYFLGFRMKTVPIAVGTKNRQKSSNAKTR